MAITVACACGTKLAVKETLAGKKIRCPKCSAAVDVPGAPAPAVPEKKCIYCGKGRPAGPGNCPHCGRGLSSASVAAPAATRAAQDLMRVALEDAQVEVREKPSTEAGVVLRLAKGHQFFIDREGDAGPLWIKVQSITGKAGYIPAGTKVAEIRQAPADDEEGGGFFAPERAGVRKGMFGGILMMVIAAVWFWLGWEADRIFFYPPILFIIGLYAFFKGLFTGNVAGSKE